MSNLSGSFVKGNFSGRLGSLPGNRDIAGTTRGAFTLSGIHMGGPTSVRGDTSFGRHMQIGVVKNTTDGNPSSPSLSLLIPGMWRFRWVVKAGTRSISIYAKQNSTGSAFRPSLIVKANPNVGLNNDISGSAPAGSGWQTIGPVSFTSTGTDVVWVELWNNNLNTISQPALFDHIVAT